VSIALAHCRTFKGNVAISDPCLSKHFFCKFCFENLAIPDSWDIIEIPKQFIRR